MPAGAGADGNGVGDATLWGGEPILCDGASVGNVTSAGYGHSIGGVVALGNVEHPEVGQAGFANAHEFAVQVGDVRVPAKLSWRAAHDPKGTAMRL